VADQSRVSAVDLSGSIGRATWNIAWPVMLTQALYTMLNVVDMFWVGRLGPAAVAAVALSGSALGVLFAFGQLFSVSAMAVSARAAGAESRDGVVSSLRHSLLIALVAAVPIAVLGVIFSGEILRLFRPAADVVATGRPYLQIIFAALPGFYAGMVLYSVYQALGDTRTPMFITFGTNVLNLVLDPILIFGWLGMPRLGVPGAALATIVSQAGGLVAMALILRRRGLLRSRGRLHQAGLRTVLGIGVPAALQAVTRPVTGMAMFAIVTGFGTAATAAFGIGVRVLDMMFIYLGGLGSAGEALVGQSLGRGDPSLAEQVARRVMIIATLLQLGVMPLIFWAAPAVVRIFNGDPQVVRFGAGYLRVLAPFLALAGLTTGFISAQRGAGSTTVPMIAALVANWAIKLPLAAMLARLTGMGVTGVWFGIGASIVAELAILAYGYLGGAWKRKKVAWN
jgi:putative MATE family efflux protein